MELLSVIGAQHLSATEQSAGPPDRRMAAPSPGRMRAAGADKAQAVSDRASARGFGRGSAWTMPSDCVARVSAT